MIVLHDRELHTIGPLDDVTSVEIEDRLNDLNQASMEMPVCDPMVEQIVVQASFARIHDGNEDKGYYRFASMPKNESAPAGCVQYTLQSAECTLLDTTLDGWHELGGTEMSTREVLEYILARQHAVGTMRWHLGDCDFEDYYLYNFEDVTLLEAIMSLGEVLIEPYEFVFDSTSVPWTMHLRRADSSVHSALVYRRNMTALRRSVSGSVVTRLYGRGCGEGDNQLTIASVNGGRDYLDADAHAMERWGIREGVHVDTRQTDPATLMAHMRAILDAGSTPRVSYEADAIDLHRLTGEDWDRVPAGSRVMILDEVLGDTVTVRVTSRKQSGLDGHGGAVSYVLDNTVADTAEALNEVMEKIGVHELYSQGATNMYSMQISDNADDTHPLTMKFYVPGNVLRINSCRIMWNMERFRTYTKLIQADEEKSSTSKSGGGATVSTPSVTVSVGEQTTGPALDEDGGANPSTTGPKTYLGNTAISTSMGGSHHHAMTHTHGILGHDHKFTGESVRYSIAHNHELAGSGALATGGIYSGNKNIDVKAKGTVNSCETLWASVPYNAVNGNTVQTTGDAGDHAHDFDHVHEMPHLHSMAHEHMIPPMTFTLSGHTHTFTIPEHTHEIEYGVFEGKRGDRMRLIVDGEEVPEELVGEDREMDIAPWLRKNADGKVLRGTWHNIEFAPDALTRITANLFFQVFIQSRGAGDY